MDQDRRGFLKKVGQAAWVVPAMQVVNMSAAAAGTAGSVVDPTSPPPSTTEAPECSGPAGWTKAVWTGNGWAWSGNWVPTDCFDARGVVTVNGASLGAVITGDRRDLVVVIGDRANIVETAYKSTGNATCGQGTLSPGFKLAAFRPVSGELTSVELLLELCD